MSLSTKYFDAVCFPLYKKAESGEIPMEQALEDAHRACNEIKQVQARRLSSKEEEREIQAIIYKYTGEKPPSTRRTVTGILKKLFLGVIGLFVGLIVWLVAFWLVDLLVGILASIPLIGAILYYPSDAGWATIVLPPSTAVPAGAFASLYLTGSAKMFSVAIILFYIFNLIAMVALKSFSFPILIVCVISVIAAGIFFPMTKESL